MKPLKKCPVCDSTEWNYDVVDYSTGTQFCGDCYQSAIDISFQKANKARVFQKLTKKEFNLGVKLAKEEYRITHNGH